MGRVVEPPDRLGEYVAGYCEQQHRVGQRGDDLQPVEPERALAVGGRAAGGGDRCQRHADAEGIGGHVPGVGQQRERAGCHPHHDLHEQEHDHECEGDAQTTGVASTRTRQLPVRVAVVVVGGVRGAHIVSVPRPGVGCRPSAGRCTAATVRAWQRSPNPR